MAPAAETRKTAQTAGSKGTLRRAAAPEATMEIVTLPAPASASAPAVTEEIAILPTPASASALSDGVALAPKLDNSLVPAVGQAPATTDAVAGAGAGEAVSSHPPATAAGTQYVSTTPTAPIPSTAISDDLVPVRTKDPDAADRIVSYCSKITSSATDPTTVAARCRQDEMDAWTRLVVQNEFPTLDETSPTQMQRAAFSGQLRGSGILREVSTAGQLGLG